MSTSWTCPCGTSHKPAITACGTCKAEHPTHQHKGHLTLSQRMAAYEAALEGTELMLFKAAYSLWREHHGIRASFAIAKHEVEGFRETIKKD